MASITTERSSVNPKAVSAKAVTVAQDALVKRLGEEVGQGLDANIEQMLGRNP